MSLTVPQWLNWETAQLGVTESPPQSNDQKYGAYVGENGVAWCAIAAACSFLMNGIALPFWSPGVVEWCLEAERAGWFFPSPSEHETGDLVARSWQGLSLHDPNLNWELTHMQAIWGTSGSALNLGGGNQNDPNSGGIFSRDTATIGDATILGVIKTSQLLTTPHTGPIQIIPGKPTKSPSHPNPRPMLYMGQPDSPQDRRWTTRMQAALNLQGPDQDGVFGPKTDNWMRGYQGKNGLSVDGVCGPKTYASLKIAA